jgi:hypothetical protein
LTVAMNMWDPSGSFTSRLSLRAEGIMRPTKCAPSFPYSNRFLRLLSRRYLRLAMSSALCYWDYSDRLFHCQSLPFLLFLVQDFCSSFYRPGRAQSSIGSGSTCKREHPMKSQKTANRSNRVADVANPSSEYLAAAFGAVAASDMRHGQGTIGRFS